MHSFEEVVQHFGGISALAEKLGITTQAISQWDELIPEGRAFQIQVLSGGKFQAENLPVRKRGQAA